MGMMTVNPDLASSGNHYSLGLCSDLVNDHLSSPKGGEWSGLLRRIKCFGCATCATVQRRALPDDARAYAVRVA